MVKVLDDNQNPLATYTYGASNQRLISEESNLRTYYNWSGAAVCSEYSEANLSGVVEWSKNYIYLGGRLIATQQPTGNNTEIVQYHHPDRLGTRLITNSQDTNVQEQVTLPYGVSIDAETTGATNRRFTSYDRSNVTGLDYAVNRHYDSQQGRFTQVDPIGMRAASLNAPQTLNMYAYCGNDPINHIDPDGLFFKKLFKWIGKALKWVAIALAVVVAVALISIALGPEGSLLLKFGLFLWNNVAPILATGLAAVTGSRGVGAVLGPGGTPPWNQNIKTGGLGGIFSYTQQQGDHDIEWEPDDVLVIDVWGEKWPFPTNDPNYTYLYFKPVGTGYFRIPGRVARLRRPTSQQLTSFLRQNAYARCLNNADEVLSKSTNSDIFPDNLGFPPSTPEYIAFAGGLAIDPMGAVQGAAIDIGARNNYYRIRQIGRNAGAYKVYRGMVSDCQRRYGGN